MTKSYMLIDGNSLGHAAVSTAPLSVDGRNIHAIFQTLKMIKSAVSQHGSKYHTPIVLWDGNQYWRKEIFPEYKQKPETPSSEKAKLASMDFKAQRPDLIKAIKMLGITQIIGKHLEADDLAGYISKLYSQQGSKVMLVSGDKDWLQLINQFVTWYDPIRKRECSKASFEEFTGFSSPVDFVQGKALIGDAGDNISGIDGIGAKCAPLIMQEFGSVEGLIENFQEHKCFDPKTGTLPDSLRRYRTKLNTFCESEELQAKFARNILLMDLMNVELNLDDLKIVKSDPNMKRFKEFCEDLSFMSITKTIIEWNNLFGKKRAA